MIDNPEKYKNIFKICRAEDTASTSTGAKRDRELSRSSSSSGNFFDAILGLIVMSCLGGGIWWLASGRHRGPSDWDDVLLGGEEDVDPMPPKGSVYWKRGPEKNLYIGRTNHGDRYEAHEGADGLWGARLIGEDPTSEPIALFDSIEEMKRMSRRSLSRWEGHGLEQWPGWEPPPPGPLGWREWKTGYWLGERDEEEIFTARLEGARWRLDHGGEEQLPARPVGWYDSLAALQRGAEQWLEDANEG